MQEDKKLLLLHTLLIKKTLEVKMHIHFFDFSSNIEKMAGMILP